VSSDDSGDEELGLLVEISKGWGHGEVPVDRGIWLLERSPLASRALLTLGLYPWMDLHLSSRGISLRSCMFSQHEFLVHQVTP
jgi:hypothetical protein